MTLSAGFAWKSGKTLSSQACLATNSVAWNGFASLDVDPACGIRSVSEKDRPDMRRRPRQALEPAVFDGGTGQGLAEVAQLLGRIHGVCLHPDLNARPAGSDELRQHGRRILSMCTGEDAVRLGRLEPLCSLEVCGRRTLVHGDVVPGNLIRSNDGLTVIDWQYPGIGDPADDIACFLSPGMQMTNGGVVIGCIPISLFQAATAC